MRSILKPLLLAAVLATATFPSLVSATPIGVGTGSSPIDVDLGRTPDAPWITISRDLQTGAYSYESSFSNCVVYPYNGVGVECYPDSWPGACVTGATIAISSASVTHVAWGSSFCSVHGWATAHTWCSTEEYATGYNSGACSNGRVGVFGVYANVKAVCRSYTQDAAIAAEMSANTLTKGSTVVTCTYP